MNSETRKAIEDFVAAVDQECYGSVCACSTRPARNALRAALAREVDLDAELEEAMAGSNLLIDDLLAQKSGLLARIAELESALSAAQAEARKWEREALRQTLRAQDGWYEASEPHSERQDRKLNAKQEPLKARLAELDRLDGEGKRGDSIIPVGWTWIKSGAIIKGDKVYLDDKGRFIQVGPEHIGRDANDFQWIIRKDTPDAPDA